jgi:DNA invertase Pin-like site-specific DNA recombinase
MLNILEISEYPDDIIVMLQQENIICWHRVSDEDQDLTTGIDKIEQYLDANSQNCNIKRHYQPETGVGEQKKAWCKFITEVEATTNPLVVCYRYYALGHDLLDKAYLWKTLERHQGRLICLFPTFLDTAEGDKEFIYNIDAVIDREIYKKRREHCLPGIARRKAAGGYPGGKKGRFHKRIVEPIVFWNEYQQCKNVAEVSRRLGVDKKTTRQRLKLFGWTPKELTWLHPSCDGNFKDKDLCHSDSEITRVECECIAA